MKLTHVRTLALLALTPIALAGCSAGSLGSSGDETGGTTITYLVDNSAPEVAAAEALAAGFTEANPDITVEVETRPGGSEGDNIVKTRLATGEMSDVFMYNSGSLFQQISPTTNLQPLTDEPFMDAVDDSFKEVVTADGGVYGVPDGIVFGGGVLYNKPLYEELGLSVPTTWDEFLANSAAIEASGAAGVVQTYGDTWTSQLLVLGDFHNVAAANPDWAEQFTANEVKFASTPEALASFQHLQDVQDAGLVNDDFASALLVDGLRMVADGTGGHYPMLSNQVAGLSTVAPELVDDVGFFALPGADAATNGMTTWSPNGIYVPTTTEGEQLDAVKQFLAYVATPAACDAYSAAVPPAGPYAIDGCTLPDSAPAVAADVQAYLESGEQSPALEFLSPIKGPALEQITVEVGSGIRPAADGAALYDEDVEKQAQQLGLAGW